MDEIDPTIEALNRAAAECSPEDIDRIIAYQRKSRGQYEMGEKPKKGESTAKPLSELLKLPRAPGLVTVTRRL